MDRVSPVLSNDDRLLGHLVDAAGFEAVSDFEVARLRRRISGSLAGERRPSYGRGYAVAAAALAFAALSLIGLGSRPPASASLALTLTEDGSVRIAYADGRPIERVVKTQAPAASAEKIARVAGAREYVDKNGQPRPGTVVFYKVD
ncbi:MAG: hypothetical protein Q9Q40_04645 [Acidobacteriota bacterium]|nr:hypothetical protein [Acidobacteriota bacterium]